ncbi:hypothetical protein ACA910_002637 [Epithemia clementina (nom. ined.)]
MVVLLRWQIFSIYGVALLSIWLAARQALLSQSDPPQFAARIAVDLAPLWGVVLLGIYGIGSVAYGVIALRDHKEVSGVLEQEVAEVKKELQRLGILDAYQK